MANYVLEILDGDRAGEVLPVADRPLRIGRKPGNDVVLADEKTSGVHAEIVLEGDRHVLRDLGSTNGTFLDGKRVTELVLSPGDVVTVGRLRVKFRNAADEAATVDAGELAVRTLDSSRLQRRSGSVGIIAAVVVLGLGGAGWFWWQGQQAGANNTAGQGPSTRSVLAVAGNKLAAEVAGCETDAGFELRAAGAGFQSGGSAHTGTGALVAQRVEGNDADFAVLRTKDAIQVLTGRSLTLAAHVRTTNGGKAAVRAVLQSANENVPFRFRTGSPLAESAQWQRVEVVVAVPPGCDRLLVEVAAILPSADATVAIDDIAVLEGGNATGIELKLPESGQAAIGTGAALALRSVDADNPAILLHVLPGEVPAPLQGLHKADLCTLSDLGATLACTASERGFHLEATGTDGLQLVLPADAGSALRVAGAEGKFASIAADGEWKARSILVGDRLTRAVVRSDEDLTCKSRTGGGLWRLFVPVTKLDTVLAFRSERQQAAELLRRAAAHDEAGQPGAALDRLVELEQTTPMDSEILGQAMVLRGTLLEGQRQRLRKLQDDLEQATFFTTRGGFERVVSGVDELMQLYGDNLEDKKTPSALRAAAQTQLDAIVGRSHEAQRTRLDLLAKSFRSAQQEGLASLVQKYIDQHLSK